MIKHPTTSHFPTVTYNNQTRINNTKGKIKVQSEHILIKCICGNEKSTEDGLNETKFELIRDTKESQIDNQCHTIYQDRVSAFSNCKENQCERNISWEKREIWSQWVNQSLELTVLIFEKVDQWSDNDYASIIDDDLLLAPILSICMCSISVLSKILILL